MNRVGERSCRRLSAVTQEEDFMDGCKRLGMLRKTCLILSVLALPGVAWGMVNKPPFILAEASVSPNPAAINQTLTFTVGAYDGDNDPMTYSWDFGDGSTGTGNPATHAYSTAGTYTATVSVSDGKDITPSSVDVSVHDPLPAIDLLRARLYFAKDFGDRIILRVRMVLPDGYDANGDTVTLNVGGVITHTTLNDHGGGLEVEGPFRLRTKLYKRKYPDGTRLLRVLMMGGRFVETLEDEGLLNEDLPDTTVNVQVTVTINGETLSGNYAGTYRSITNFVGKLR